MEVNENYIVNNDDATTEQDDDIVIEGKCPETREISDPDILEAMMASLKEAEEALEDSSNQEGVVVDANDNIGQTFEITKMTVPPKNSGDAADAFVFSNPSDEDVRGDKAEVKGMKPNQKKTKPVTKKRSKRKGKDVVANDAPPAKRPAGRPRKVIDETKDYVDESFSNEEEDSQLSKGDTDYKPASKNKVHGRKKMVNFGNKPKKSPSSSQGFLCSQCSFVSDTLGELKIHRHNTHESSEAPSFLDMAEAAIVQVDDGNGVEEISIFKDVLFDHFDTIGEDKLTAERILKQALREGVKLGRLRMSRKGRGRERFKLVTKTEMMKVAEKWKKNKESVEFVTERITAKKRVRKANDKVLRIGGGKTIVKYLPRNIGELKDDDVEVLEEKLTAKTWAKQRSMNMKQVQSMKMKQMPKPLVFELSQSFIPQHPNSLVCEEDDPNFLLTCPACLFNFWYEQQTLQHMELDHGDDETVCDVLKAAVKKVAERERDKKPRMTLTEGEKIVCDVDIPGEECKEEIKECKEEVKECKEEVKGSGEQI